MSDGFGKLSNAATDFSWGSSGANEKTNLFNKKANPFGAAGGGPASADTSNLDWGESSSFAPAASGNGFGAASFGSPAQNGTGKGKGAKPPVVVYDEDGEEEDDEGDFYDEGDFEGDGEYEGDEGDVFEEGDEEEVKEVASSFGSAGAFGGSKGLAFGGASTAFSNKANFGAGNSFGSPAGGSAFGASGFGSPAGSAFGAKPASGSAFGASTFGSPAPATGSAFGAPAGSAFGAAPTNGFAAPSAFAQATPIPAAASTFGSPSSAFSMSTAQAFGAKAGSAAFGTGTAFGASKPAGSSTFGASTFGSPAPTGGSAFGTPAPAGGSAFGTSTFGSPAPVGGSAFGASTSSTFGAPSGGGFGAKTTPAAAGFGAKATPVVTAPKSGGTDTKELEAISKRGGLLREKEFWDLEDEQPILTANNGFLTRTRNNTDLEARLLQWLLNTGVTPAFVKEQGEALDAFTAEFDANKTVPERIFVRDADRTYVGEGHRKMLIRLLSYLQEQFGSYHQGLGLAAGFLLLIADRATTVAILSKFNTEDRYVPGIWKAEAIKSATDAYVYWDLVAKHMPAVSKTLKELYVGPELYCQKYFCALSVHVLPFESLYVYFDRFTKEGYKAMFVFALNIVKGLEQELLAGKDTAVVLALLRLDQKECKVVTNAKCLAITQAPEDPVWGLNGLDWPRVRQAAFDDNLKARLERANKAHAEVSSEEEYDFSDEEDVEGAEEEEEEEASKAPEAKVDIDVGALSLGKTNAFPTKSNAFPAPAASTAAAPFSFASPTSFASSASTPFASPFAAVTKPAPAAVVTPQPASSFSFSAAPISFAPAKAPSPAFTTKAVAPVKAITPPSVTPPSRSFTFFNSFLAPSTTPQADTVVGTGLRGLAQALPEASDLLGEITTQLEIAKVVYAATGAEKEAEQQLRSYLGASKKKQDASAVKKTEVRVEVVQALLAEVKAAADPRKFSETDFVERRRKLVAGVRGLGNGRGTDGAEPVARSYALLAQHWGVARRRLAGVWDVLTVELASCEGEVCQRNLRRMFAAVGDKEHFDYWRYQFRASLNPNRDTAVANIIIKAAQDLHARS